MFQRKQELISIADMPDFLTAAEIKKWVWATFPDYFELTLIFKNLLEYRIFATPDAWEQTLKIFRDLEVVLLFTLNILDKYTQNKLRLELSDFEAFAQKADAILQIQGEFFPGLGRLSIDEISSTEQTDSVYQYLQIARVEALCHGLATHTETADQNAKALAAKLVSGLEELSKKIQFASVAISPNILGADTFDSMCNKIQEFKSEPGLFNDKCFFDLQNIYTAFNQLLKSTSAESFSPAVALAKTNLFYELYVAISFTSTVLLTVFINHEQDKKLSEEKCKQLHLIINNKNKFEFKIPADGPHFAHINLIKLVEAINKICVMKGPSEQKFKEFKMIYKPINDFKVVVLRYFENEPPVLRNNAICDPEDNYTLLGQYHLEYSDAMKPILEKFNQNCDQQQQAAFSPTTIKKASAKKIPSAVQTSSVNIMPATSAATDSVSNDVKAKQKQKIIYSQPHISSKSTEAEKPAPVAAIAPADKLRAQCDIIFHELTAMLPELKQRQLNLSKNKLLNENTKLEEVWISATSYERSIFKMDSQLEEIKKSLPAAEEAELRVLKNNLEVFKRVLHVAKGHITECEKTVQFCEKNPGKVPRVPEQRLSQNNRAMFAVLTKNPTGTDTQIEEKINQESSNAFRYI
jgi:hypothetical protein